jgi:hypothetical protein
MPRNQRLTKVIAGRTVKVATVEPGGVLVLFDDQSNMKIKTAGPATIPPGGKIKSVHEAKADFKIEFEDGSSATFCLANPGSSVAVRDKNNAVEYLG